MHLTPPRAIFNRRVTDGELVLVGTAPAMLEQARQVLSDPVAAGLTHT